MYLEIQLIQFKMEGVNISWFSQGNTKLKVKRIQTEPM